VCWANADNLPHSRPSQKRSEKRRKNEGRGEAEKMDFTKRVKQGAAFTALATASIVPNAAPAQQAQIQQASEVQQAQPANQPPAPTASILTKTEADTNKAFSERRDDFFASKLVSLRDWVGLR
jgi:hypothetical protein